MFISDDEKATVGTINLDYRSLFLHFEDGCFIYKNKVINRIEEDYQKMLSVSKRSLLWIVGTDLHITKYVECF